VGRLGEGIGVPADVHGVDGSGRLGEGDGTRENTDPGENA